MRLLLLLAHLFSCISLSAQDSTVVKNLVFEGAGIRGIAYAGAITELEARNILPQVKRIGGTSAGAIIALMVALRYSPDTIVKIINSTAFQKFNDGSYAFVGGAIRTGKYYGWYKGEEFEKWLSHIIFCKTGNSNITFKQLHDKGYMDLYVTATNLTKQRLVILSFENYPHMKVKDAVRISMSIPLYFEAVFMDSAGKVYYHPKKKTGLDVMVDGGIIGNFPIRMFDSTKYIYPQQPNTFMYNPQTLAFRIDSKEQIENDRTGNDLATMPINGFKQYMAAFYTIVIEKLNRQQLTKDDWRRTVSISDGGIAPRVRKLCPAELDTLIENGCKAVNEKMNDRW